MDFSANFASLAPVIGTVISIRPQPGDCTMQMLSLSTETGPVNFIISPDTHILNDTRLRAGMRVVAYYDASLPVPLIFPPQYRALLISTLRPGEQVNLSRFDRSLTAMDRSLRLNVVPSTTVQTLNGQNFSCPLGGRVLLVFHSNTTRSIPPQTTPRKIVVLS